MWCLDFAIDPKQEQYVWIIKILYQTREKWDRVIGNDYTSVHGKGGEHELYTGIWMAQVQGWMDIHWQDQHIGGPISSKMPDIVARTQQLIREDIHQIIHDLADDLRICYGDMFWLLNWACIVSPPNLYHGSCQVIRSNVCKELLQSVSYDATFLSRVITSDESWFCPETKQQSSQLKIKTHQHKNDETVKTMIIFFSGGLCTKNCPSRANSQFHLLLCVQRVLENMLRHPKFWWQKT